MNCREFQQWLDLGKPAVAAGTAQSHGDHCARCRREMAGSTALEAALVEVSVPTSAAFTTSVMDRVVRTPQVRVSPDLVRAPDSLPWWVQAAAQPAAVLAFAILSLLLWQGDTLIVTAGTVGAWLGAQVASAGSLIGSMGAAGQRIYVMVGLFLGFSPLLVFLYLGLYRGSLRLMLRISGSNPSIVRQ